MRNILRINFDKTEYMVVGGTGRDLVMVIVERRVVKWCNEYTYFGVIISGKWGGEGEIKHISCNTTVTYNYMEQKYKTKRDKKNLQNDSREYRTLLNLIYLMFKGECSYREHFKLVCLQSLNNMIISRYKRFFSLWLVAQNCSSYLIW